MNPLDKEVAEWMYSLDAKPHQYGGFIVRGDDYNSDQIITKWEATFFYTAFKSAMEAVIGEDGSEEQRQRAKEQSKLMFGE
jgi:hypothetical protein